MARLLVGTSILALALGGIVSVAAGRTQNDDIVVPRELEGSYFALAISKGGKEAPDEYRREFSLKIVKNELLFDIKGKKYPATITKIQPKAKPATIDIAPSDGPEKGKTFLGIYTYTNGELMLAFTEKGDRPKDFTGDDDATVLRLRKLEKKGKKN